jgi:preprotein translocase subunit SecY
VPTRDCARSTSRRTQHQVTLCLVQTTNIGNVIGITLATLTAARFAHMIVSTTLCARGEALGIVAALAAGSCLCLALADFVTYNGLGNGYSFFFMVNIASGARRTGRVRVRPRALFHAWWTLPWACGSA